MPIAKKIIGRVPLWFEYVEGNTYSSMNRVTYYGSEFQVKMGADGNFITTTQPPGHLVEGDDIVPNSDWILISNVTPAHLASDKIKRYWIETESPEFVEVHTDDNDKVLYGVQQDGNFYFGGGVPQQIKDFIGSVDPGVHPGFSGTVYYGISDDPAGDSQRSVTNSIAGQYTINIDADGSYIYFFVPSSVDIISALIGGLDMPRINIGSVNIGGVSYKKYRSTNTYNSGSITIVLS